MTEYRLNHAYEASRDGLRFGRWEAGEVVDLEPADAEWIERDSPGALKPVTKRKQADEKPTEDEPAAGRQKPAGADRQHRGGANRGG